MQQVIFVFPTSSVQQVIFILCLQATFIQKLMERYRNELDISAKDFAGRTPLFLAAENSHVSTIQVRLAHSVGECNRCNISKGSLTNMFSVFLLL